MATRDDCTDSGRLGQATNVQRAEGYTGPMDFSPTTVAEQNDAGGWNKTDVPVGGPANRQKHSTGSRGAENG